jgi:hypothetical protein
VGIEGLLAAVPDILFITKRETRLLQGTEAISTDVRNISCGPDERIAPPPGPNPGDAADDGDDATGE